MYCPKCGTLVEDDHNFCPKCGTQMPGKAVHAPVKQQKSASPAPTKPAIDVQNVIKRPPVVVSLRETVDFKGAETALDNEGLKTRAFSGMFNSAQPNEVRVDALTKVYEPVHMVRAIYEGEFEVMKEFTLQLDPGTVKLLLDGKPHDIPPAVGGGTFGGATSSLKLAGMENIKKRVEKGAYYDMNGVQKNNIENFIKGKDSIPFDPSKQVARTQVLATKFDASGLADKVMTPDIVQRVQNAKSTVKESITVDIQTIYYPKYKALVTNLKSQQQKYLIFSAVDKQILSTETF